MEGSSRAGPAFCGSRDFAGGRPPRGGSAFRRCSQDAVSNDRTAGKGAIHLRSARRHFRRRCGMRGAVAHGRLSQRAQAVTSARGGDDDWVRVVKRRTGRSTTSAARHRSVGQDISVDHDVSGNIHVCVSTLPRTTRLAIRAVLRSQAEAVAGRMNRKLLSGAPPGRLLALRLFVRSTLEIEEDPWFSAVDGSLELSSSSRRGSVRCAVAFGDLRKRHARAQGTSSSASPVRLRRIRRRRWGVRMIQASLARRPRTPLSPGQP